MKKEFSIYLDFLRFFAAVLVFLSHSISHYEMPYLIFRVGHEAVIIFFVLSGYVIAFVRDTKEKTLRDYALSRISRVYSVAVPALLLTVCIDFIGQNVDWSSYGPEYVANDLWLVRFMSSLLFTNELWLVSIQSFSNVPYWSLNYEVWYYISFACLSFSPPRIRWYLFGACLLVMGPKIAILAPIWWIGVWCYRTNLSERLSTVQAAGLVTASLIGVAIYFRLDIASAGSSLLASWIGDDLHHELAFSKKALGDYFLTACVVVHFIGMRRLAPLFGVVLRGMAVPIRWLAGYTFILYLTHQPLFLFYRAVLGTEDGSLVDYITIITVTLLTILILGNVSEKRKHVVKRWAGAGLDAISICAHRVLAPYRRGGGRRIPSE